ncbi:MAG: hypothetical protein HY074_00025 [Deltaproteobacteria bacterium]|nr:hypothetical protein [Deltaproteobacteria bacterium]
MLKKFLKKLGPVYSSGATVALVVFCFLLFTLPLAFERVAGGRSAERQAYTAGIIRIYCQEPGHSVLQGPQIHFGRNPFNLELTLFEWVQGVAARVISGPECDTEVEVLGKVFSIVFSAIGVLAAALLAAQLWGPVAGAIAAILLGTDELWLRYATYTMIENRVLTFGVFAILFSLRRRPFAGGLAWALTFMQKPQIFVFCGAFWLGTEIAISRSVRQLLAIKRFRKVCVAFAAASVTGFAWFAWSNHVGTQGDLPWIIHTGPRIKNWYFGNWQERVSFGYVKNLLLAWFKESGINAGLPLITALWFTGADAADFKLLMKRALPLLAALFIYTFTFYPVFIWCVSCPLSGGTSSSEFTIIRSSRSISIIRMFRFITPTGIIRSSRRSMAFRWWSCPAAGAICFSCISPGSAGLSGASTIPNLRHVLSGKPRVSSSLAGGTALI